MSQHQLEQIRGYLRNRDITLCRIGRQSQWVALGLPLTPTLRYRNGHWEASHTSLQKLVNQAIGK